MVESSLAASPVFTAADLDATIDHMSADAIASGDAIQARGLSPTTGPFRCWRAWPQTHLLSGDRLLPMQRPAAIIFMQCGSIRHTSARPVGAPPDLEVEPRSRLARIVSTTRR